jgi:hypothetical protein
MKLQSMKIPRYDHVLCRVLSSEIYRPVVHLELAHVSEEHAASVIRVEE